MSLAEKHPGAIPKPTNMRHILIRWVTGRITSNKSQNIHALAPNLQNCMSSIGELRGEQRTSKTGAIAPLHPPYKKIIC